MGMNRYAPYTHRYLIPRVETLEEAHEAWLVWAEREQTSAVDFELVRIDIFVPMDWINAVGQLTYQGIHVKPLDPRTEFVAMYNHVRKVDRPLIPANSSSSSGSDYDYGEPDEDGGATPHETTPLLLRR